MNLFISLLTLVALAGAASLFEPPRSPEKVYYDNYAVFKLETTNQHQRDVIRRLISRSNKFDVWSRSVEEVRLMVNPQNIKYLLNVTASEGIRTEILISNVQSLIDDEQRAMAQSKLIDSEEFKYNQYHTYEEINELIDEFLTKYSDVTEQIIIGKTLEGRTIRGIKISYKPGNPGVYIESNIHAREWITSATAIWFINQLLSSEDTEVRTLAESHDWYIIPVFNIDGFKYSHEVDRMWRKNRRVYKDSKCSGVDINRNFDSHWMEVENPSQNPCDETNAGSEPFSEPESLAESKYVISIKNKINLFIALHSYGQYVIYPWGYSVVKPENAVDLEKVGQAFIDAVAAQPYKTNYKYGQTIEVVKYYAAGVASDWAYDQGIKLSYTIEMRDRDYYGFILPPAQILSNCEEVMAGIIAMTKKGKELNYM